MWSNCCCLRGAQAPALYVRSGQASSDKRGRKVATFAVEGTRCPPRGRGQRLHRTTGSQRCEPKGGRVSGEEGLLKESLLQIVSVTTQVAISQRASQFKLQLRDRQDVGRNSGGRGGGVAYPYLSLWREDKGLHGPGLGFKL